MDGSARLGLVLGALLGQLPHHLLELAVESTEELDGHLPPTDGQESNACSGSDTWIERTQFRA